MIPTVEVLLSAAVGGLSVGAVFCLQRYWDQQAAAKQHHTTVDEVASAIAAKLAPRLDYMAQQIAELGHGEAESAHAVAPEVAQPEESVVEVVQPDPKWQQRIRKAGQGQKVIQAEQSELEEMFGIEIGAARQ